MQSGSGTSEVQLFCDRHKGAQVPQIDFTTTQLRHVCLAGESRLGGILRSATSPGRCLPFRSATDRPPPGRGAVRERCGRLAITLPMAPHSVPTMAANGTPISAPRTSH